MAVGGSAYPPRPNSLSTGKEAPEIRRGTHKRVRGHCPRKHRIAPLGRVGSAGPRPGPARPCLQSKPSSSPPADLRRTNPRAHSFTKRLLCYFYCKIDIL